MRTAFYIDGFNLYYGSLRGSTYKWLDVQALAQQLRRADHIVAVHYFTARIRARPKDPDGPNRQGAYLAALEALPLVTVTYGLFKRNKVKMQLVTPREDGETKAKVWKSEEKGSDVNLACQLLKDAFLDVFDLAVVVSNDSDLATPIRMVTEMGKPVGIVNPHSERKRPAELRKLGTDFQIQLKRGVLEASQLPDPARTSSGYATKPPGW